MAKFNSIQFAAGIAVDFNGELEDLHDMIKDRKAEDAKRQYNHLSSLITGMKYTIGYIADKEAQEELNELMEDFEKQLSWEKSAVLALIYSEKLDSKVTIITHHKANGETTYSLVIDGVAECGHLSLDLIKAHLAEKEAETK